MINWNGQRLYVHHAKDGSRGPRLNCTLPGHHSSACKAPLGKALVNAVQLTVTKSMIDEIKVKLGASSKSAFWESLKPPSNT